MNGNGVPARDEGNGLLTEVPVAMSVTPVNGPSGSRLMVTVRTTSTTLTVLLPRDVATNWASTINAGVANMSGLILPG